MAIEDRDDYVDMVAQAVIDRIEERHRTSSLVEQVVARVIEIQKKEAALKAEAEALSTKTVEE
jgi:ethanolamine utilization protein EutQ (cupin superfamily)